MTENERIVRDAEIVAGRNRGLPTKTLAQRFRITDRQVQRIVNSALEHRAVEAEENRQRVMLEFVAVTEQRIADLVDIYENATKENTKVQAVMAAAALDERKVLALQLADLAPADPAAPAMEARLQNVARRFAEVIERFDLGDDVSRALAETLD